MLVASSTPKLVAATGLAVFAALVVHFLAQAISTRRRFYKTKAIGIPIITVIEPELCSQLTQETPQPRHFQIGWALTPVTDGIDLLSMNMADHKVWRSRLNPGFSSRNVIQNMPEVLEEVSTFAQKLKDTADADSQEWGNMFTLYDRAIALTFDVISRFALDLHLHEQTSGPGPLLKALRNLIPLIKLNNIKNSCWVFYEINKHPGILQKLRIEHDQVLGSDPKSANKVLQESPHKLNELHYTTAVIKETLRIHPLANTLRQGSHNFNFSLDGIQYPTYDCLIQTTPAMTHIHPDLWPRPTDFIPNRFLVPNNHALYPVKNAWRAFELGNTRCIGQELAMLELKLALVFTVRELDFDINYELWDKMQKRETSGAAPETVNGERAYSCGGGTGVVKDDLPIRYHVFLG
ncbi:hypothetical protein V498_00399 [Pseudogymnoascus sp. VKM F-4517 (FW-2822)]|nr:hypothetical protein V498_00399 [Pseudogymnoascus sp. VKM F-4517 (FW-2822)]